jgi:hypothetical protein
MFALKRTHSIRRRALAQQHHRAIDALGELVDPSSAANHQPYEYYPSRPTPPRHTRDRALELEVRACVGAVLSPLLANIALSMLDRNFQEAWAARRWHSQRARDRAHGRASYRMIRYADDFVVLVRGTDAQAHAIKKQTAEFMREQMRLTLSPEKTAITHVDAGFDLLRFRVKRAPWRANKRVAVTSPSRQALRAVMHRIKTLTNRSTVNLSLDQLIHVLNPILRGWANYYRHAASSRCLAYLSHYLWWRVIRWLRKKYPAADLETDPAAGAGDTTGPAAKARGSPGPTRSR